jgi:hypothetical protein
MNTIKNRYIAILMGSIMATGLQGMSPEATPKHLECITSHFDTQTATMYRNNAIALRDMVFDKYKRGVLSSVGGLHAEVESIAFEMLDKKNPNIYINYPSDDAVKSECNDEERQKKLIAFHKAVRRWDAQRSINFGCLALTTIIDNEIDPMGKNPDIYVSSSCVSKLCAIEFSHVILHELAHALDANQRKPAHEKDYSWLEEDVKDYPVERVDREGVDREEWHAEKQSIAWLKEYRPDDVQELKKFYEDKVVRGEMRSCSPAYPPYSVLAAWLRDPKV